MTRTVAVAVVLVVGAPPSNGPATGSVQISCRGATFYKATQGSRIRIACNATNWQDDSVSLILWFKGSLGAGGGRSSSSTSTSTTSSSSSNLTTSGERQSSNANQNQNQNNNYNAQPIYTIDARQRSLTSGQARHLVADSYRGRAKFVIPSGGGGGGSSKGANNQPAAPYLDLAPLEAEDQGEFRCRVDYRSRPRENFLMILFVLGRPPPALSWVSGATGKVIDESYLTVSDYLALQMSAGHQRPASYIVGASGKATQLANGNANSTDQQQQHQQEKLFSLLSEAAARAASLDQHQHHHHHQHHHNYDQRHHSSSDKNLTRRAGQSDSINSYVSLASSTTTSTTADQEHSSLAAEWEWHDQWSVWPELDYFGRSLDKLDGQEEEEEEEGQHQEEEEANQRGEQKVSQSSSTWSSSSSSSSWSSSSVELLDLKVDQTITTSVNVLHINELSRELYTSLMDGHNNGPHSKGQPGEELTHTIGPLEASQQLAKLECRASNLHYDLRTLIKMFAPPSLVGQQPSGQQQQQQQQQRWWWWWPPSDTKQHSHPSGRLLVGAIQRALEASTRLEANATSDQQHWLEEQQQQHQEKTAHMSSQPLVGQIKVDSSGGASPVGGRPAAVGSGPSAAATTTNEAQSAWPNVIYQQLVRPHQLSSAAAGSGHHEPLTQSRLIALDAYLRPLDVKLLVGSQRPLAANNQPSEFTCTSSGSKPPARLTWLKNGRPLEPKLSRQLVDSVNGSSWSTSKLLVKLERDDHGAQLTCRAENPAKVDDEETESKKRDHRNSYHHKQQQQQQQQQRQERNESSLATTSNGWTLEDSIILNVQYQPKLKLELGNKMLSEQIREGSDIYFVCSVDAQPAISELSWLHDERPISEDTSGPPMGAGRPPPMGASTKAPGSDPSGQLIMSNNSLVLQRVRIDQRGKYTCMASNSEGVSVSNSIDLRVLHAPICVGQTTTTTTTTTTMNGSSSDHLLVQSLALPLKAQVNLNCLMSADPIDDGLHFTWYLNNSHNERRVIFESSSSGQLEVDGQQQQQQQTRPPANKSSQQQVAKSLLRHYSIETNLDYGRLFCVASNAIGQQKRACVYQIEPPSLEQTEATQFGGTTTSDDFNCLPVNVTSRSVWIGCHLERPPPLSSNGDQWTDLKRIKFQVLVHDKSSQQTVELFSDQFDAQQQQQQQREEQMPNIFELNNLRPNSNYLLEISALSSFDGTKVNKLPQMIHFKTLQEQQLNNNNDHLHLANGSGQELASPGPDKQQYLAQIKTISALNNHQSDLVASALQQISTRSANSRDLIGSPSSMVVDSSSHLQRAGTTSKSSSASIWSSLARLFGNRNSSMQSDSPEPLKGATRRPPSISQKVPVGPVASYSSTSSTSSSSSSKLMDFASDSLLVGSMCLVLMITLISLLLIRRLVFRREQSSRKPTSAMKMNPLATRKTTDHETYGSNESNSSDGPDYVGLASSIKQDHQVAGAAAAAATSDDLGQSPGYSCSNSTMLDYVDSLRTGRQYSGQLLEQSRPLDDGRQLIDALSSRDMLATSSLQRRHQPMGSNRMSAVKGTNTNQNGHQLLNNNKANNKSLVYGELAGQVNNVPRSRSSLSFGGSVTSMAGAGQQAAPRLIHLSGQQQQQQQQQPGDAQQQHQQQQLLISDANVAQAVNDIDLSLAASVDGHQLHGGQTTACWLAGPYIQVAAAAAIGEGHHLNNEQQNNERYQIMLPAAAAAAATGRCHVRGQQQQHELEASTSLVRRALGQQQQQQQQVAPVKPGSCQSDGFDSNGQLVGGAVCSCDESQHSGHTSHSNEWPPMMATSQQQTGRHPLHQRVGRRDFILTNNEINHNNNNNNHNRYHRHHSASLMSDESSDHSNQVASLGAAALGQPNHHNHPHPHPPLYVGHHHHRHYAAGQQHHQEQLGFAETNNEFIQLIQGSPNLDPFTANRDAFGVGPISKQDGRRSGKQEPRKLQVLANVAQQDHQQFLLSANLNNYNNNYQQQQQQQSLTSCSPSTTNTTNTTNTTTTTANNSSSNHALGSSPISIESSGATLSQDHPIDLLQQMSQQLGPVHCIDNESIDEQHTTTSATSATKSNSNSNSHNSRPMNNGHQPPTSHLASILKNSQRAQGNLVNDDNLNQGEQQPASPALARLNQFSTECQCNANSNNNNNDSSTNL